MSANDTSMETRLAKVRSILRAAAHEDEKAYGGLRLWELERDALMHATLAGSRLIAPDSTAARSCCGSSPEAAVSRSSSSGLVQGLRGLRPFDGSQYPRLPWGYEAMSAADTQFIADWIDDGCPARAREANYPVSLSAASLAPVLLDGVPEVANGTVSAASAAGEYEYQAGELRQRMNIDCLSVSQLERFRHATRELYALNKWPEDARNYNNLALVHQNHCQHGWERFLTWHRVYLYEFEQALQDHCPEVTVPYWDFTMPAYRPHDPARGLRIPRAYQAYLTQGSLEFLREHGVPTEGLEKLVGCHFATQTAFFSAVAEQLGSRYDPKAHRERFIDALLEANSLWYPLRYPGEYKGGGTIEETIHYHYPSARDIEQILGLRTFRDFGGGSIYNESFGFLDQNPHNTMHIWTGGMNPKFDPDAPIPADRNKGVRISGRKFHKREDLYSEPQFGDMFSNLTAAHDPVFWPIHVNVDRLWWEWQERHPDAVPAELDAALTPWGYTARETLDIYRFGYEYVRGAHVLPIGVQAPVGRFVSKVIDVPAAVRDGFRKAEVRLLRVPPLPRSCFVRIFVNLPDANANTPLDHPNYGGYLAIFGHGPCYGGPGHCEVPAPRKFDLRPRNHNTPSNHRVDVSECVKAAFARGASSIQLTLVVIGADYREDDELLRLQGISINFLD